LILCFDKLSMNGKITSFQRTTVRPEPVEGQSVCLGNSPLSFGFAKARNDKGRF
jgi:hypothetical protein